MRTINPLLGLFPLALLVQAGCSTIPANPDKPVTLGRPPVSEGLLANAASSALRQGAEGTSAFLPIPSNRDALRWRLALIDEARDSIEVQTFIWSDDESGRLILDRILAAADRGVRVRLLVDDMPKDWSDRGTAVVARMPNLHLRRFNPGRIRTGVLFRALQMSANFSQLNRRMHNKQMIVDGQWAIVGGRNIGNPYFGMSREYNNCDLDLLTTGPIVAELTNDFDEYWNADAAFPGEAMAGDISAKKTARAFQRFEQELAGDQTLWEAAGIAAAPREWGSEFAGLPDRMRSGRAGILADAPVVEGKRGLRLIDQLEQLGETVIEVEEESCVISPYMIPSQDILDSIVRASANEGRRVRLLVPSMESNNHTLAHSHYRKYRKRLLEAGAELHEFRGQPSPEVRARSDTPPVVSDFVSLHAKAFVLDREWVLLGSLNLDPRSIEINTEHMLVIRSRELADDLADVFDTLVGPDNAWAVTLDDRGRLRWSSSEGVRTRQPARGFGQRCADFFFRWLPIEGQL